MWDMIKKVFHFIMTVLLYSLFAIIIIVAIMVGLYFVDHYKSVKEGSNRAPLFGAYVIISPSMVPNINVLDAVVTMRTDADKLKKNDVITFVSQDPRSSGVTVTHRIVGIKKTESGAYAYRTKGDNNNVEDYTLVSYDHVIGKVMLRIPYIGYLQQLLTTQFGWIVVIVLPCLFIIISDLVKLLKVLFMKKEQKDDVEPENSGNLDNKEAEVEPIDNFFEEDIIEEIDSFSDSSSDVDTVSDKLTEEELLMLEVDSVIDSYNQKTVQDEPVSHNDSVLDEVHDKNETISEEEISEDELISEEELS